LRRGEAGVELRAIALEGLPRIRAGDDLAAIIGDALSAAGLVPAARDVLVVAQKVVSKAEGRLVRLAEVVPSAQAVELAVTTGKDPRLVEVILSESRRVVRARSNVLIVQHRLGYVMANAGVDQSNLDLPGTALLLPRDPDASAAMLRRRLAARFGVAPGVIVSDSFGRAWRRGSIGTAVGVAGLPALLDFRGEPDLSGRRMEVTVTGFADQIASTAALLTGEGAEGRPVVLVRGLAWSQPDSNGIALIRQVEEDLFL
jgi:coenzyme F420-0:L-glutamate ligase/coenzyme F420-1:gamma-L-glutamate ligase